MKKVKVEKRKNAKGEFTSWQYRFEAASVAGKRKWISKAGFETEEEAYTAGMEAKLQYQNGGQVVKSSEMSVADFLDLWYNKYCVPNLKQTSLNNYREHIKVHINPYIGKLPLKSVSTDALQGIIDDMFQQNYARTSIANIQGTLKNAFQWAKKRNYITVNPAVDIVMPLPTASPRKGESRRRQRDYIKIEDVTAILERFPEGHTAHIPLVLAYRCGLRRGEAYGLCWEDIDFDKKTLTVKRQLQYDSTANRIYVTAPKYNSYRTMPLDRETLSLLARTLTRQKDNEEFYDEYWVRQYVDEEGTVNSKGEGVEYHFTVVRDNGKVMNPNGIAFASRIIHTELGIEHWDFHSMRHTHCADLIDAGLDITTVKTLMGHKTIQTTLDIYDHMTKKKEMKSSEIIESMYSTK